MRNSAMQIVTRLHAALSRGIHRDPSAERHPGAACRAEDPRPIIRTEGDLRRHSAAVTKFPRGR